MSLPPWQPYMMGMAAAQQAAAAQQMQQHAAAQQQAAQYAAVQAQAFAQAQAVHLQAQMQVLNQPQQARPAPQQREDVITEEKLQEKGNTTSNCTHRQIVRILYSLSLINF